MATAALSGSCVPSVTEQELRDGGETVIITLTGDTWVSGIFDPALFDPALFDTVSVFNAVRQGIIDGSDGDGTEWDAEKSNLAVTDVVRTSATVLTITLSQLAGYGIADNETVSWTIPGAALVSGTPIVASNSFTIQALQEAVVMSISGWFTGEGLG